MKSIKIAISIAVLTLFILSSCSKDDGPATPNASDITVTIDENPANGVVIGTVTTNISGTLTYSLTSESVANAFVVNSTTGEVTVSNGLVFDFETNPTITASVNVSNSSEAAISSVSVTLNDIDDISSFLVASQAAYVAAASGDWVTITAAEFNTLANNLNQVSKIAMNDTEYDAGPSTSTGSFTLANNNGFSMPSDSYVFAVKYNLISATPSATIKLKQSSTSISDGYADLGGVLGALEAGNNFAVLKGSNAPTTSTGFLAISDSGGQIGWKSITGNELIYDVVDVNTLGSTQANGTVFYQGLSSTQKQWD